ncbi:MAG: NAD(P)-dependent oxidoreductase, partial [Hyphomicrobiales bacterium]
MTGFQTIGFIGLGVMGEPMCRNLKAKTDARIMGFDIRSEPMENLADVGVTAGRSVAELAAECDLVLLSLPGRPEVEEVCLGPDGIADHGKPDLVVADLSTCPVATARKVGAGLERRGIAFADAPVTRTAVAALDGTLSIMVGGDPGLFERLKPL